MSGSQGTLESVHSTASKVVTGKPPVVGDRSHVVGSLFLRAVGTSSLKRQEAAAL